MPTQPLQPSSPPAALLAYLPSSISGDTLIVWLLIAVFAFWAVYTLVAIYHWLQYSHGSLLAFPAIGVHLFISISLMVYALSGTFLI